MGRVRLDFRGVSGVQWKMLLLLNIRVYPLFFIARSYNRHTTDGGRVSFDNFVTAMCISALSKKMSTLQHGRH